MSHSELLVESPGGSSDETEPADRVVIQELASLGEVDLPALRDWVESLVAALVPGSSSLVVRLTSDDEVRRLNETYRSRPGATDVLSFEGEETPEGPHLGDVVIAVGVAERQAREAGRALQIELRQLILHGVLHCLGHDHETDGGEMEALEGQLRDRWIGRGE